MVPTSMQAVVKILVRFCASVAVTGPVCPELFSLIIELHGMMGRVEEMAPSSRIKNLYEQVTSNEAYDPSSKIFETHCMTALVSV